MEHVSSPNTYQAQQPRSCGECQANAPKYKCPVCCLRSCSLSCINSHKKRTGCTGMQTQTQFVPFSRFDDKLLFSDYNLLEKMKRVAESANRMRSKSWGGSCFKLPYYLQALRKAAASRRTELLFQPSGMTKREKNKSRYEWRKNLITWTIEWHFHSTNVTLLDHGVREDSNLYSVISKHLRPGPWNHPLRKFCEEHADSLSFLIQKCSKGPTSRFCKLDMKAPIKSQLVNIVIVEYPVFYVALPSHCCDFIIVKDVDQVAVHNISPHPVEGGGIRAGLEEIEICPIEPLGTNGLKNNIIATNSPILESPNLCNAVLGKEKGNSYFCDETLWSLGSSIQNGTNMEFDFDQDLINAYSDIISQFNPDDFLDLESQSEFNDDDAQGQRGSCKAHSFSPEFFLFDEELEEGEIAE